MTVANAYWTRPALQAASPAACRVLVVDVDPDGGDAACRLFRLCGYDARAASPLGDALAAVAGFRPHAAVVDLDRAGAGERWLESLGRLPSGVRPRVGAVAGHADEPTRRRLCEWGVLFVSQKAADPATLVHAVAAMCGAAMRRSPPDADG